MDAVRQAATHHRRQVILDAALAVFVERGVSATTVEDILERANASVGSLYHHFPGGKEAVAAALYLSTIGEYQAGFLRELRRHRDAPHGVKATVRYHLLWVRHHPSAARFLFQYGDLEARGRTESELSQLNSKFFGAVHQWTAAVGAADVGRLPVDVATALWLGPAQQFARRWLADAQTTSIERAARLLADAAWSALSSAACPPESLSATKQARQA